MLYYLLLLPYLLFHEYHLLTVMSKCRTERVNNNETAFSMQHKGPTTQSN